VTEHQPHDLRWTADRHRRRAADLRARDPNSHTAELHELAARAHELEAKARWLIVMIKQLVPSPSIVPDDTS
jgi:hypothetical protein